MAYHQVVALKHLPEVYQSARRGYLLNGPAARSARKNQPAIVSTLAGTASVTKQPTPRFTYALIPTKMH